MSGFCAFAKSLPEPFNTYQDSPLAFWVACQREVRLGYVPRKLFRYRLHGANHSGDATSVAKAIRNVRRTRNTMQAMREIAIRFNTEARVLQVTDAKLRFYTYLDDLYSARRWAAIRGFFASLPYLITGTSPLLKEVVRFLGSRFSVLSNSLRWLLEEHVGLPCMKSVMWNESSLHIL